jgi:hypothetical protein
MNPNRIMTNDQKRVRYKQYFKKKDDQAALAMLQREAKAQMSLQDVNSIRVQLGKKRLRPLLPK